MTETKRSKNGILIQKCTNRPEKKKKNRIKRLETGAHILEISYLVEVASQTSHKRISSSINCTEARDWQFGDRS